MFKFRTLDVLRMSRTLDVLRMSIGEIGKVVCAFTAYCDLSKFEIYFYDFSSFLFF